MTAAPPSNSRSKWPIGLVVVVVIGIATALVVANGGFGGGSGASASPLSSVEGVVPADSGVVSEGRALPVAWAEVVSGASGRVAAIPVKIGDTVAAGDTLLQLDDEAAGLGVESATAAQASAGAAKARAAAGVTQAKAAAAQAASNVSATSASIAQAQATRRAAVAARDAIPSGAPKATKRQADAQIDQASAGVDAARAQRDAARQAARSADAGVVAAQAALDAATADAGRAGTAVKEAEAARDQLRVTSPIAGSVVTIGPAVGDLVQPGAVAVRVADLSAWRFETSDLSETSITRVHEGAAAKVTVDGLPGIEIPGTVETVGGYGASSQGDIVFRVVVAPSGSVPEGVRWNMTVTIEIDGVSTGS